MQAPDPLVSIIMPVYNGAAYIAETINSIRRQQYQNWELLIMDDGSTDDTVEIVRGIGDKRIRLYAREHTGITGRLKNEALWRAQGEFIALIDSDDLWPEEKLQKQVDAMQQYPEAGFSFTNGYDFYEPGIPDRFLHPRKEGIECRSFFLSYCKTEFPVQTSSLLFRESCVTTTGLFHEDRVFTDFSFIGNLAYHFKAVILYEPLLMRRLHRGNFTRLSWLDDYQEHIDTIRQYMRGKKISRRLGNKLLFRCFIYRGEKSLSAMKWAFAYKSFLAAWSRRPWSLIPLLKLVKTSSNALLGVSDFSYRKMAGLSLRKK
jgi:glycosyltransferase involved in cell wall biosynthesis